MVRFLSALIAIAFSTPAFAAWNYDPPSEGNHYAWTTDGGFVEGSYQNGLHVYCPDVRPSDLDASDQRHRHVLCVFRVTLDGKVPQSRDIVTFSFDNGKVVESLSESVQGGQPQLWLGGELLELMLTQNSVTVSTSDGASHTFSLKGSAKSLRTAMGFDQGETAAEIARISGE